MSFGNSGGGIKPPFRIADFLSDAYYAVSITVVMFGLLVYVAVLRQDVSQLQRNERDHPTKAELAVTANEVHNAIASLEQINRDHPTKADLAATELRVAEFGRQLEELDIHGTRALADRVLALEQINKTVSDKAETLAKQSDAATNELHTRFNSLQDQLNRINEQMPLIVERQRVNTAAIIELEHHAWTITPEDAFGHLPKPKR